MTRASGEKQPSRQLLEELPSASDYSDLDTPAGSPGTVSDSC